MISHRWKHCWSHLWVVSIESFTNDTQIVCAVPFKKILLIGIHFVNSVSVQMKQIRLKSSELSSSFLFYSSNDCFLQKHSIYRGVGRETHTILLWVNRHIGGSWVHHWNFTTNIKKIWASFQTWTELFLSWDFLLRRSTRVWWLLVWYFCSWRFICPVWALWMFFQQKFQIVKTVAIQIEAMKWNEKNQTDVSEQSKSSSWLMPSCIFLDRGSSCSSFHTSTTHINGQQRCKTQLRWMLEISTPGQFRACRKLTESFIFELSKFWCFPSNRLTVSTKKYCVSIERRLWS